MDRGLYHNTRQQMHYPTASLSWRCPDILNMLSMVVSMVLSQYLHAFCPQRQQKRKEREQNGKKSTVFTLAKAVSQCVLHLCTLLSPPIPLIPRSSRLLEGGMIEGCYPCLSSCKRRSASLQSKKHQLQRCSKDQERKREGCKVSHIPLKHNKPCTSQMQGYGKSLFAGLKGCSCYMGQMVYQQEAKRANLPESSIVLVVATLLSNLYMFIYLPCALVFTQELGRCH